MSVTKSVRARDDKVDDLRIVETSHTRFIIDVDVTYVRAGRPPQGPPVAPCAAQPLDGYLTDSVFADHSSHGSTAHSMNQFYLLIYSKGKCNTRYESRARRS